MDGLERRILSELSQGPMLFEELLDRLGADEMELLKALDGLVRSGRVRYRPCRRTMIFWLDGGNGHLSPADWELLEGLVVLQVLEAASRLS